MCMMRAPINRNFSTPIVKYKKQGRKPLQYDKETRMKPDADFVDERVYTYKKSKKSFLQQLFSMF